MAAAKIDDKSRKLLEGPNFAHVSTVMPDGTPQVTPVWIDVDGDNVLLNTVDGHVKTRNLRRNPRIGLAVSSAEDPYVHMTMRGKVIDITPEGADDHIDKLTKKYLDQDTYPFRTDEVRVIIRVEPERVSFWGA